MGIDEDELAEFVSIKVHCRVTNVYLEIKLVVLPLDMPVKEIFWLDIILSTQAHKCWKYILMNLLKGSQAVFELQPLYVQQQVETRFARLDLLIL